VQTVLETPGFTSDCKEAGISDEELADIIDVISSNPKAGEVIPGTGGARKLRFAKEGGGKRGGYRTIHYYAGEDVPVFLLALVAKNQRADISQKERNQFRERLPRLAAAYRRR
jgi:hypothetical protein